MIDSWQRGVQLRVFVNNVAVALRAVLKLKLRHGNGFFDLFLASAISTIMKQGCGISGCRIIGGSGGGSIRFNSNVIHVVASGTKVHDDDNFWSDG